MGEGRNEEEVPGSEGEGGGPGPPWAVLFSFVSFLLSYFPLVLFIAFACLVVLREQEIRAPQYDPDWLGTGFGHAGGVENRLFVRAAG